MTCYTSALSSAAYAAPSPSTAAVRLFSLNNSKIASSSSGLRSRSATSKVVHLVRHAEGTHNLNEKESKKPAHFDAKLTSKGVEQCNLLSRSTGDLNVEAVIVSPMTRCLETARLSFPHLYDNNNNKSNISTKSNNNDDGAVPFIAHEEWRETVNFLCDSRSSKQILQSHYPRVNFDLLSHDDDPIWSHYENTFGCYQTHTGIRESNDPASLYNRAHLAWKVLLARPERNLALVGHSAFFMHMFTPLFDELEGVVSYEDEEVRELMTGDKFENCELRSVVVDVPI